MVGSWNPKARWSLTPAPSSVGWAGVMDFTGLIDMASAFKMDVETNLVRSADENSPSGMTVCSPIRTHRHETFCALPNPPTCEILNAAVGDCFDSGDS